jgi:hypothetical protein
LFELYNRTKTTGQSLFKTTVLEKIKIEGVFKLDAERPGKETPWSLFLGFYFFSFSASQRGKRVSRCGCCGME